MKICIDIDDYHPHPKWDCTDVILKILDSIPEAKFTMFFTPFMKRIKAVKYMPALERVRDLVAKGSVEIFLHGLTHKKLFNAEFGALPRLVARRRIKKTVVLCEFLNIEYKRGFKFPWHVYNKASLRALEELDLILFSNKYEMTFKGKQVTWQNRGNVKRRYIQTETYRYGEPGQPEQSDTLYYYRHAQDIRDNGIRESYGTFLRELTSLWQNNDVEFIFSSELIE